VIPDSIGQFRRPFCPRGRARWPGFYRPGGRTSRTKLARIVTSNRVCIFTAPRNCHAGQELTSPSKNTPGQNAKKPERQRHLSDTSGRRKDKSDVPCRTPCSLLRVPCSLLHAPCYYTWRLREKPGVFEKTPRNIEDDGYEKSGRLTPCEAPAEKCYGNRDDYLSATAPHPAAAKQVAPPALPEECSPGRPVPRRALVRRPVAAADSAARVARLPC
jgi:hypothetical protein